ncbi:hypothetical protein, partial [Klebsiella pneumoniae]|uniref:hypothetical protein n=1 Tax=Klebsiella pneumoniae TaxID=573 RepID=UPI00200DDE4E
ELISRFSLERVHSGGARFDYEKAKWFNHEWIKRSPAASLQPAIEKALAGKNIATAGSTLLTRAIELVKDRCTLLTDFADQLSLFFVRPATYDL